MPDNQERCPKCGGVAIDYMNYHRLFGAAWITMCEACHLPKPLWAEWREMTTEIATLTEQLAESQANTERMRTLVPPQVLEQYRIWSGETP